MPGSCVRKLWRCYAEWQGEAVFLGLDLRLLIRRDAKVSRHRHCGTWLKLLPGMATFLWEFLWLGPASKLPDQFPAKCTWGIADVSVSACVTVIHVGEPDGVPGSWLQSGSTPVFGGGGWMKSNIYTSALLSYLCNWISTHYKRGEHLRLCRRDQCNHNDF